jgi:polyhydroxyalkanoate synthesis regulator phasin
MGVFLPTAKIVNYGRTNPGPEKKKIYNPFQNGAPKQGSGSVDGGCHPFPFPWKFCQKDKEGVMSRSVCIVVVLGVLSICLGNFPPCQSGEVDLLIQKLVEKGILTQKEARELVQDMQRERAEEQAGVRKVAEETAKEVAKEETASAGAQIPGWLKDTKVKGDFRFRYQTEDRENDTLPERDTWKIRWRLAADTKLTEQWRVGFGLASGSDNPRSANVTLGDAFSTKEVSLDLAYARYTPWEWLSFTGGKFQNPIWGTKDMLYDSDIRPEGIAATSGYSVAPGIHLFFTPAYFVLDEFSSDTDDPYMFPFQLGVDWRPAEKFQLKLATTYYEFGNVKGFAPLFRSSGTNSVDGSGNLIYDYDAIAADALLGYKWGGSIPYGALFGQYVQSFDPSDENRGWLAGAMIGWERIKEFGHWQLKYNYRRLERDAWPDAFPDSEAFRGATNAKGHEAEFSLGLARNVWLKADYYFNYRPIVGQSDDDEDLFQVDLNLAF